MATVASVAGSVIGLAGNIIKARAIAKGFSETAAASTVGENTRELQMRFESQRSRRQKVREAVLARSMSLSTAVNQGAQKSSGAEAGMQGASSTGAENQQTVNSSEILGSRVFQSNRLYHAVNANSQALAAGGDAVTSAGNTLFNSADALGRIFGVK